MHDVETTPDGRCEVCSPSPSTNGSEQESLFHVVHAACVELWRGRVLCLRPMDLGKL